MSKFYVVVEGEGIGTKRISDFVFQLATSFRPDLVFETEDAAQRHAEHMATQKLGKEIYIMMSIRSVSARKPTIVIKQFNDKGELLPF